MSKVIFQNKEFPIFKTLDNLPYITKDENNTTSTISFSNICKMVAGDSHPIYEFSFLYIKQNNEFHLLGRYKNNLRELENFGVIANEYIQYIE